MKAYREQVDKGEILDRTLVFKLIFDGGGGGSSSSSSGSGGGGGGGGGGGRGSGGDSDVDLDKRIQSFVTATEEKARSGFQAPERKPDDSSTQRLTRSATPKKAPSMSPTSTGQTSEPTTLPRFSSYGQMPLLRRIFVEDTLVAEAGDEILVLITPRYPHVNPPARPPVKPPARPLSSLSFLTGHLPPTTTAHQGAGARRVPSMLSGQSVHEVGRQRTTVRPTSLLCQGQ